MKSQEPRMSRSETIRRLAREFFPEDAGLSEEAMQELINAENGATIDTMLQIEDPLVQSFFMTLSTSNNLEVFQTAKKAERYYIQPDNKKAMQQIALDCMTRLAFIKKDDVRREFCIQEAARQIRKTFETAQKTEKGEEK